MNAVWNGFYALMLTMWLMVLAPALPAQTQVIPRDTVLARQLESAAVQLRQPVPVSVIVVTDSTAIKALQVQVAAQRAIIARQQSIIDSLTAAPPVPPDTTTPPVPPDTTTPPPIPPDTTKGLAQLPLVYLNFTYPIPTRTVTVAAGANLQTALNNAQRGDELALACGATWTGNFILPVKSAAGWITVRSACLSQLPPIGTRVDSSHAPLMPKLVTANTQPALKTAAGTKGWWLAGIEVTVTPSLTAQQYGLLTLGEIGSAQSTLASVPQDIVLDRMYVHGQAATQLSRCVALNSARTRITDGYISECHGKGFDSQAIGGQNGPGPYQIVNNYLEGAGENLMFGGGDPNIPGLVPCDIEIRGNHLYTPVAWKGKWTKKNLFETKNACRVLFDANVLDGSWIDGQTGWGIVLKSTNQSGGCRWCRSTDITISRIYMKNVGAGINVATEGNYPADTTVRRITIRDVVMDSIALGPFTGDRRGFQQLRTTGSIEIVRTVLGPGNMSAALIPEGGDPSTYRDNVWNRGQYGVIGDSKGPGLPTLDYYAPNRTWANMTFIGASNGPYPPGTTWVSSESQAPLAAKIRATVDSATKPVVVKP